MPRHTSSKSEETRVTADDAAKAILDLARKLTHGPGRRTGGGRVAGRVKEGSGGGDKDRSRGHGGSKARQTRNRNPMRHIGAMIVGGVGGNALELLAGDEGDMLVIVDGSPAWRPRASAAEDVIYAEGDVVVDNAGNFVVMGGW